MISFNQEWLWEDIDYYMNLPLHKCSPGKVCSKWTSWSLGGSCFISSPISNEVPAPVISSVKSEAFSVVPNRTKHNGTYNIQELICFKSNCRDWGKYYLSTYILLFKHCFDFGLIWRFNRERLTFFEIYNKFWWVHVHVDFVTKMQLI